MGGQQGKSVKMDFKTLVLVNIQRNERELAAGNITPAQRQERLDAIARLTARVAEMQEEEAARGTA